MKEVSDTRIKSPPRLIIAGAPASGKGTQCEIIKEKCKSCPYDSINMMTIRLDCHSKLLLSLT